MLICPLINVGRLLFDWTAANKKANQGKKWERLYAVVEMVCIVAISRFCRTLATQSQITV